MPVYTAEIWVDAPVDRVWDVLVDFDRYPEWNPFTPRVEATLQIGTPVALTTRLGWITLTQVESIREVVPRSRVVWGDTLYLGSIRAERVQTLEAVDGGTRYRTVDRIEGFLGFVVAILFGSSLERGFSEMAEALAARCVE